MPNPPRAHIEAARAHLDAGLTDLVKAVLAAEGCDDWDAWTTALSARNATHEAIGAIDGMDPLEEVPC